MAAAPSFTCLRTNIWSWFAASSPIYKPCDESNGRDWLVQSLSDNRYGRHTR